MVEQQQETEGAPVEQDAEATRSAAHLFQFSQYVHAPEAASECEHASDGACTDPDHFHAWVCMPNTLQHHDIEEKAAAARARRQRAMREEGSDAYAMLEAELDALLEGDREAVLEGLIDRSQRDRFAELVRETTEEERFEHYHQDAEEYRRLKALPEDQRGDDFETLDARMSEFGDAVTERVEEERTHELELLRELPEDTIRERLRASRIEGAARAVYTHVYYQWLMFICTRKVKKQKTRCFESLVDLRDAPPEVLKVLETVTRDLELRFLRGGAAGN